MRHPPWVRLALALVLAGTVRLAWDLARHWNGLLGVGEAGFWSLLLLRCLGLAAGAWILGSAFREVPTPAEPGPWRWPPGLLPAVAGILLAAVAAASLVQLTAGPGDERFVARSAFRSALLLGTSLWLGLGALSARGAAGRRPGGWRWVGPVAVNLLVALALLEGIALMFARARPTRLLWDERSARATIEANRLEPGSRYLGFRVNSGGYYDEEFHPAGPDDLVVALLADSFGVGVVPHKHNFATVMERRLRRGAPVGGRVSVHNFGVVSIGLPEYAWLLENEVPAVKPSKIVLALFVGNDISALASRPRRGFYSVQQFQLFELGRRLAVLDRERRRGVEVKAIGSRSAGPMGSPEQGTFDEATFLEIEREAVEPCNTGSWHVEVLYRASFDWLARLQAAAGDKLLVVLIPDEYQVNDALYEALMRRVPDPAAYHRFYPQDRLRRDCRELGIEVLDLLDPLREANGERPVYWLRDTHWNGRGNRIAGEAIARHLLEDRRGRL